jgi:hypothetical protein
VEDASATTVVALSGLKCHSRQGDLRMCVHDANFRVDAPILLHIGNMNFIMVKMLILYERRILP